MIASLDHCLGDTYLTKDKATLLWQASELSSKADRFLSPPARAGCETPGSDGCISCLLNVTAYLGAQESPRWALSEELNRVGSPLSSGVTKANCLRGKREHAAKGHDA